MTEPRRSSSPAGFYGPGFKRTITPFLSALCAFLLAMSAISAHGQSSPLTLSIAADQVRVEEGNAAIFRVTANRAPSADLLVPFTVAGAAITDGAAAADGADWGQAPMSPALASYTAPTTGSCSTITPAATDPADTRYVCLTTTALTATITIDIVDDAVEPPENFTVTLGTAVSLGNADAPTLSTSAASTLIKGGPINFTWSSGSTLFNEMRASSPLLNVELPSNAEIGKPRVDALAGTTPIVNIGLRNGGLLRGVTEQELVDNGMYVQEDENGDELTSWTVTLRSGSGLSRVSLNNNGFSIAKPLEFATEADHGKLDNTFLDAWTKRMLLTIDSVSSEDEDGNDIYDDYRLTFNPHRSNEVRITDDDRMGATFTGGTATDSCAAPVGTAVEEITEGTPHEFTISLAGYAGVSDTVCDTLRPEVALIRDAYVFSQFLAAPDAACGSGECATWDAADAADVNTDITVVNGDTSAPGVTRHVIPGEPTTTPSGTPGEPPTITFVTMPTTTFRVNAPVDLVVDDNEYFWFDLCLATPVPRLRRNGRLINFATDTVSCDLYTSNLGETLVPEDTGLLEFGRGGLAVRIRDSGAPVPALTVSAPALGESAMLTWNLTLPAGLTNEAVTGWQYRSRLTAETFSDDEGVANGWQDITGSDKDSTTHTLYGLTAGSEHFFQVRLVTEDGKGAASTEASITPAMSTGANVSIINAPDATEGGDLVFPVILTGGAAPASGLEMTYSITPHYTGTTYDDDVYYALPLSDYGYVSGGNSTDNNLSTVAADSSDAGALKRTVTGATLSIPAGTRSAAITVATNNHDDSGHEPTEAIRVTLTSTNDPAFTINDDANSAVGSILDNDDPPEVGIRLAGAATRGEDAGDVVFEVTVATTSSSPLLIAYAPTSGSTLDANDYAGDATGTVTISPYPYIDQHPSVPAAVAMAGLTERFDTQIGANPWSPTLFSWNITVPIIHDIVTEGDETLTLAITSVDTTKATISSTASSASVTITNAAPPLPSVSISDAVVTEGDAAVTMVFTVNLTQAPEEALTVTYQTADGPPATSATAGTDYTAISQTSLVIAAGTATTANISVTVAADFDIEPPETFELQITAVTGDGLLGTPSTATGTILSNDVGVWESLAAGGQPATPIVLTEEGATYAYQLSLAAPPTGANGRVVVEMAAGSELPHLTVTPSSLTFRASNWSRPQAVTLSAGHDANSIDESGNLVYTYSLSSMATNYPGGVRIRRAVTIADDDPVPEIQFTPPGYPVTEHSPIRFEATEGDPLHFGVTLSPAPVGNVTVTYIITGGTATLADHGGGVLGSATIRGDGATTAYTITVPTTDDAALEGLEYFTMTLRPSTGATLGTLLAADGVIIDGEAEAANTKLVFRQGGEIVTSLTGTLGGKTTYSVNLGERPTGGGPEGDGGSVGVRVEVDESTVTLSGDFASDADGTAPEVPTLLFEDGSIFGSMDWYVPKMVTVTTRLSTPATFTVTHRDDVSGDNDDAWTDADNYGGTEGNAYTIDLPVNLHAAVVSIVRTATAREDDGAIEFEVTLSAASREVVTVTYKTANSDPVSATADGDYAAVTNGSVEFAVGDTTATITITITDDAQVESDETFVVQIDSVRGGSATVGAPFKSTGTIIDDESLPTLPEVSIATTATAREGDGTINFVVTLSAPPSDVVTVAYETADSDPVSATAGTDYTAVSTTRLEIAVGTTTATIPVTIADDAQVEQPETFVLRLTEVTGGATLGTPASSTGTITDNEGGLVVIEPGALSITEGETDTYTLRLRSRPTADVTVDIAAADDGQTAVEIGTAGLVFAAADWNEPRTVTIEALADKDAEDETLTIVHTSADGDDAGGATTLLVYVTDAAAPFLEAVGLAENSEAMSDDGTTYGVGERIVFELRFSKAVRVIGTPRLRINVGDNVRFADYYVPAPEQEAEDGLGHALAVTGIGDYVPSPEQGAEDGQQGSGSTKLLFAYVIESDDMATEGISVPDNPLEFEEGDAIVDAANADLPAYVAGDEDDPIEINIPVERTKVDGTKDFLLQAEAGDDQEDAKELSTVTLDGSESRSGDPDDIEYAWAFKGGEDDAPRWLDLDNADEAVATFTVPNLPAPVELAFELTVTGSGGETDTDEVVVKIDATNDPPTAQASARPSTVDEGEVVTLIGTGSDPEGQTLTFAWGVEDNADQDITLDDSDEATTTFTAPIGLAQNVMLTFKLEVSDGISTASNTAQVVVRAAGLSEVLGESLSRMGRVMAASARDTVGTRFGLDAAFPKRSSGLTLNGSRIDRTVGSWPGKWLDDWLPVSAGGNSNGAAFDHSRQGDTPSRSGAGGMSGTAMVGGGCGAGRANPMFTGCGHFAERAFATQPARLPSLTPWNDLPNITSFEYALNFGVQNQDQEKREQQKRDRQKQAQEKRDQQKREQEKRAKEKQEQQEQAQEKREQQKREQEKQAQEKRDQQKREQEKRAQQKLDKQKQAQERREQQKREQERRAQEKQEQQKQAQEKRDQQRQDRQKQAQEKQDKPKRDRQKQDQPEQDQQKRDKQKQAQERREQRKRDQERRAQEKREQQRQAQEKRDQQRQERQKQAQEKQDKPKRDRPKQDQQKLDKQKQAQERREQQKQAQEKRDQQRQERQKQAQEKQDKPKRDKPKQDKPKQDGAPGLLSDVSVWGQLDTRTFESEPTEQLTLDGSMTAFYVGVDKLYNGRDMAGVALGLPTNTVDFTKGQTTGEVSLSMVNVLPYVSWSPKNGILSLWGMLGFGSGESEITVKSQEAQAADTSMTLFAGGGIMPFVTVGIRGFGNIFVTAKADVFSVNMSSDQTTVLDEQSVSASQLRAALEGRMTYPISDTALLEPLLELGLRFDGGDGDTGMGVEMSIGATFTNTAMGLSADGRGRFLVSHGGDGVAESGFSLLLLYDPGDDGGPGLSFAPVWGETASRSDALWHTQDITRLALDYGQRNHGPSGNGQPQRDWRPDRMDLSLHYGLERRRWMITPYGSLVTSNRDSRQRARLGLRLDTLRWESGAARLNFFNESVKGPGLEASLQMLLP